MSTRQLLNLTMSAFTLLLLAAVGIVFSASSNNDGQGAQIDLAVRQQALIQDLTRQSTQLADAEDRPSVAAARLKLAGTIVQFDRNLAALIHGGEGLDAAGQNLTVQRTRDESAQSSLAEAARVWLETGLPLADLAAGEYSIYSAAGQTAVRDLQDNSVELMQHMGAAANAMRMGVHASSTIAGYARWAAGGLGFLVLGFGVYRRKILSAESAQATKIAMTPAAESAAEPVVANSDQAGSLNQPKGEPNHQRVSDRPHHTFVSPVNFESVNASVDQMSVDMNTIAGSTDKMRLAIDSVGHALQGMLYSLNEMAQDTAEGHKIVRNANNAASFSAETAGYLATSAREMSAVVARVTQLAVSTKAIAAHIDADALHTGKTGEAFTSVVAGEVNGLAQQTNEATRQIEETVSGILATARQYEEAIGQIIKNVSAINKVSQNLGELMLSPPPRVEPGAPVEAPAPAAITPAPAAPPTLAAPLPASEPIEEPVAQDVPEFDELFTPPAEPEETTMETANDTADAIEEVVQEAQNAETQEAEPKPAEPASEVFMLGQTTKKPDALNIPAPPVSEPEAQESEAQESVPESTPDEPSDSAFMLDGNKSADASQVAEKTAVEIIEEVAPDTIPESTEEATPEEASVPEPVTVPADEPVATGSSENIFMLNQPK